MILNAQLQKINSFRESFGIGLCFENIYTKEQLQMAASVTPSNAAGGRAHVYTAFECLYKLTFKLMFGQPLFEIT